MNAKAWIVAPDGFGRFYEWTQTTDEYIYSLLMLDGVRRTEQEFVDDYYKKYKEVYGE